MLRPEARNHIDGLSDAELIRYIRSGTALYQPEALAYALQLFKQRQPNSPLVQELADGLARGEVSVEAARQKADALGSEALLRPEEIVARRLRTLGWLLVLPWLLITIAALVMTANSERGTWVLWLISLVAGLFMGLHFLVARKVRSATPIWAIITLVIAVIDALATLPWVIAFGADVIFLLAKWGGPHGGAVLVLRLVYFILSVVVLAGTVRVFICAIKMLMQGNRPKQGFEVLLR